MEQKSPHPKLYLPIKFSKFVNLKELKLLPKTMSGATDPKFFKVKRKENISKQWIVKSPAILALLERFSQNKKHISSESLNELLPYFLSFLRRKDKNCIGLSEASETAKLLIAAKKVKGIDIEKFKKNFEEKLDDSSKEIFEKYLTLLFKNKDCSSAELREILEPLMHEQLIIELVMGSLAHALNPSNPKIKLGLLHDAASSHYPYRVLSRELAGQDLKAKIDDLEDILNQNANDFAEKPEDFNEVFINVSQQDKNIENENLYQQFAEIAKNINLNNLFYVLTLWFVFAQAELDWRFENFLVAENGIVLIDPANFLYRTWQTMPDKKISAEELLTRLEGYCQEPENNQNDQDREKKLSYKLFFACLKYNNVLAGAAKEIEFAIEDVSRFDYSKFFDEIKTELKKTLKDDYKNFEPALLLCEERVRFVIDFLKEQQLSSAKLATK